MDYVRRIGLMRSTHVGLLVLIWKILKDRNEKGYLWEKNLLQEVLGPCFTLPHKQLLM